MSESSSFTPPSGFTELVQEKQWLVKEEGAVLFATLLGRSARKKAEDGFYYSFLLKQECKVTRGRGGEKETLFAKVGEIVHCDEFAAFENLANLLKNGRKYEVWICFIAREPIPGSTNTFWNVKIHTKVIGSTGSNNRDGQDDIPF